MFLKAIAVAGGLAGAVGLSQYPAFSQQYTQRLSGAVEELRAVVAGFDADAAALGLTRDAALRDMEEGTSRMARARAQSMRQVLARHDRLSADLAGLRAGGPVQVWRLTDADLARQTWAAFRPALPMTAHGLAFGAGGFVLGYILCSGLLAGVRRLRPRRGQPRQT